MWSQRLGKAVVSKNGSVCRYHMQNQALADLTPNLMRADDKATNALSKKRGSPAGIRSLIQDAIVVAISEAQEAGDLVPAVTNITHALHTVT